MWNTIPSSRRLAPLLIAAAMLAAACAGQPPADPDQIYAAAFDLPLASVAVSASGGPVTDAWLCFTCEDRVELARGETFAPVDPLAARDFFATVLPDNGINAADAGTFVCLQCGDQTAGEWLLFELGSGRYYYRSWGGDSPSH